MDDSCPIPPNTQHNLSRHQSRLKEHLISYLAVVEVPEVFGQLFWRRFNNHRSNLPTASWTLVTRAALPTLIVQPNVKVERKIV